MRVHPAAELFPLLDDVGLQRLAEDIRAHGLRVPIVLFDGMVLDGRNRFRACEIAKVEPRFIEHDGANPWRAVWSLNAERRQIEDKIRLALIGEEMVRGADGWEAERKMAADTTRRSLSEAGKQGGRGNKGSPSREGRALPRTEAARKNTEASRIASEVGVSRATMERALSLKRRAPEIAEQVKRGEVQGHKALTAARLEERTEKLAETAKGNKPLPIGQTAERYPILYVDPPWRYEHIETESRAIENQYPTLSLEEIKALKVRDVATPDAVLFLWATSPKLAEAIDVINCWGFTYRTSMVWVKDKIGMGYYARQRHELLLIATRGSPPTPAPENRPDSVVEAARGQHSVKPLIFAELIERMYPTLPRIELFSRSPRIGWAAWGNQAA